MTILKKFIVNNSVSSLIQKFREMEKKIKFSFSLVKEELEEHLDAINENTNEIQYNAEQIEQLSKKIDKLTQRMDEIELMLLSERGAVVERFSFDLNIIPKFYELSQNEREVLLTLYTSKQPLSYEEIARKLTLSEQTIRKVLVDLITKGIPLLKRYAKEKVYLELDPYFKHLQKHKNIMEIDEMLIAKAS